MRILIACDKFKGTLTADQANAAILAGLQETDVVHRQGIADGGEGTAAILGAALGGKAQHAKVQGPLQEALQAEFWLAQTPQATLGIFDMSSASGLMLVNPAQLDPWHATTVGTGQLLLAAAQAGADQILVGLGGSATNDGGAGLAQALGYGFFDGNNRALLDIPNQLPDATKILAPADLQLPPISALCDVESPLLGAHGATRTFGGQKGVDQESMDKQESRLAHLARITNESLGVDYSKVAGAGAAGGLGYGLMSFAQAQLVPGFDQLAQLLNLEQLVRQADLVITGEGSIDAQSLQGKGPLALALLAQQHQTPCIALCGRTDGHPQLAEHFTQVLPLVSGNQPAPQNSAEALTALAKAQRPNWSVAQQTPS